MKAKTTSTGGSWEERMRGENEPENLSVTKEN
jgi:hypothetical protein